jgi:hypothetical protein
VRTLDFGAVDSAVRNLTIRDRRTAAAQGATRHIGFGRAGRTAAN